MNESLISYHDVDVTLPSQIFNVAFSYTTKETLDFIDTMVLRLLIIAPLSALRIAKFLDLSNYETEVLLTSLLHRQQIQQLEDGNFSLTSKLQKAFTDVCAIPYVSKIEESMQKLSFEMLDFNPSATNQNTNDNGANSIKLVASQENLSSGEALVYKEFQKNFRTYCRQGLIKLNLEATEEEKNVQLYKLTQVEKLRDHSRRITLNLTLDGNSLPKEVNEFSHLENSVVLDSKLYDTLKELRKEDNIEVILDLLSELDGNDELGLHSVFSDNKLNLDHLLRLKNESSDYFIGPIYSEENADLFFEKILSSSDQKGEQNPLYWLAPSDNFWGKSDRFADLIDRLSTNAATKSFKCFLPAAYRDDRHSIISYKQIISTQAGENNFYLVNESHLKYQGGVEIIVKKDSFCALIIHARDPRKSFLTTVPIGVFISDKTLIKSFYNIFKEIESDEENFYGLLNKRK